MILNADLSQIEWRMAAFLSQDKAMITEINSGIDQHGAACTQLMKLPLTKMNRFHAKRFNFRMIYGGTEMGYFRDPTMPNFPLKQWKQIVVDFYTKYHGLKAWHDTIIKKVIDGDGTLSFFTGRTFKFSLFNGRYNEKQIKNWPVQGISGGDILPLTGVIIYDAIERAKLKTKLLLTVHDSLVFKTPKKEVDVVADLCMKVMQNLPTYINNYWGVNFNVNLTGEVEVGPTYGNLKQIRG